MYGDICFHDNYVAINADKSKTDQLRKGDEVVIPKWLKSGHLSSKDIKHLSC